MKFLNRINLKINEYFYDRIKVKQNDTARYLLFNLLDDGVPFSLENKTVRVYGLKPDGTKVFNNLTIINAARGLVELQLTTQMLVKPGCLKLELVIYEATDILSTTKFDIDIISCIRDDSAIESTNEFSALTLGLSKLDEWDKYFKETSGAIEEKYTERLNEIDSSLEEKVNKDEITNSMRPKGECNYLDLPLSGNIVGDYWYCSDAETPGNYAWNGEKWYFAGTGDEGYNNLKMKLKEQSISIPQLFLTGEFIKAQNTVEGIAKIFSNGLVYSFGKNVVLDRNNVVDAKKYKISPIRHGESYSLTGLFGDECTIDLFENESDDRIEYWTVTSSERIVTNNSNKTINYARINRYGAQNAMVGIKNITNNVKYEFDTSSGTEISCFNGYTTICNFDNENIMSYVPINANNTNMSENLIICGSDATQEQLSKAKFMESFGCGYICSETELDDGVNTFIDKFINQKVTIQFFGTIRTSHGIHKHPKHNLLGYDCVLKMGDNLGNDYWNCIFPTSGGVTFEESQLVSHNNTHIKGFTLDGNCKNNMNGSNYVFKSIYGAVISGEIYNQEESPYSRTQLATNIQLEDLTVMNSMRGIIMGIGWKGKNLTIGDSMTDHALYLAGADQAVAENVYCHGFHKSGAISISSSSWDVNRRVRNIHLKNIMLDECDSYDGPFLDIRGRFSEMGNNQSLDDIFIDGFHIKKIETGYENIVCSIGTRSDREIDSNYSTRDYPLNIQIKNFTAELYLYNSLFSINNANVIMENPSIILRAYRPDRALFRLQSRDFIKKCFSFDGMRILFYSSKDTEPYTIFGIDNSTTTHSFVNGLNLNNMCIYGNDNYYLFSRLMNTDTNIATISDIAFDRVMATPLSVVNPNDTDYIKITQPNYCQIITQ